MSNIDCMGPQFAPGIAALSHLLAISSQNGNNIHSIHIDARLLHWSMRRLPYLRSFVFINPRHLDDTNDASIERATRQNFGRVRIDEDTILSIDDYAYMLGCLGSVLIS